MLKYLICFLFPVHVFATSIAFIGDSISNSWGVQQQHCYINVLQKRFEDECKNIQCINRSYGGATTRSLYQIGIDLIIKERPDYIVIVLGINDAGHNIPKNILQDNFESMISACKHNCKRIILCGVDVTKFNPSYQATLTSVYQYLINKHNVYPVFLLNPKVNEHLIDAAHPDETGHQLMADIMYNALNDIGAYE